MPDARLVRWMMRVLVPLLAAVTIWAQAQRGENPIRVQLVTGGHPHDLSFYNVFEDRSGLDITVNPHPSAYKADLMKQYDVLVLYDMADISTDVERNNLCRFVDSGKGLVVLHHALADNQHWPWWFADVVGGRYLLTADGKLPPSTYTPNTEMRVRRVREHPVTEGLGDFTVRDEAYGNVWISPHVEVLLKTDHPASMKALAWVSAYPNSRVVYIQLGHGPDAYRNPSYRRLVGNAILWAAGNGKR